MSSPFQDDMLYTDSNNTRMRGQRENTDARSGPNPLGSGGGIGHASKEEAAAMRAQPDAVTAGRRDQVEPVSPAERGLNDYQHDELDGKGQRALLAMLKQKELLSQHHHHRKSTIEQALSPEQLDQQEEMLLRLKETNQLTSSINSSPNTSSKVNGNSGSATQLRQKQ